MTKKKAAEGFFRDVIFDALNSGTSLQPRYFQTGIAIESRCRSR